MVGTQLYPVLVSSTSSARTAWLSSTAQRAAAAEILIMETAFERRSPGRGLGTRCMLRTAQRAAAEISAWGRVSSPDRFRVSELGLPRRVGFVVSLSYF